MRRLNGELCAEGLLALQSPAPQPSAPEPSAPLPSAASQPTIYDSIEQLSVKTEIPVAELMKFEAEGFLKSLPRTESGVLLSSGSIDHDKGTCKPCLFFIKGVCKKSISCTYCHDPRHPQTKVKRIRPSKRTREQLQRLKKKENTEAGAEENEENSSGSEGSGSDSNIGGVKRLSQGARQRIKKRMLQQEGSQGQPQQQPQKNKALTNGDKSLALRRDVQPVCEGCGTTVARTLGIVACVLCRRPCVTHL